MPLIVEHHGQSGEANPEAISRGLQPLQQTPGLHHLTTTTFEFRPPRAALKDQDIDPIVGDGGIDVLLTVEKPNQRVHDSAAFFAGKDSPHRHKGAPSPTHERLLEILQKFQLQFHGGLGNHGLSGQGTLIGQCLVESTQEFVI